MPDHRSAVALQEGKLRQVAGPTARSRQVDDSRHEKQRQMAAPLNHRLVNTVARLRNLSSEVSRRASWNQTR